MQWYRVLRSMDDNEIYWNSALPTDTTPHVLIGDVVNWLKLIPSHSISCIVTSPPYWKLRDYSVKGQIGQEETPEEYIKKMMEISKEILRVMTKKGAYFLNIGDTYVNGGLQMIPQRVALAMLNEVKIYKNNKRRIKWLLRNQIIWFKPNHMPSPVTKRYTNTYEPIFYFTRNDWEKDVFFNMDGIRVPYKSKDDSNGVTFPLELTDQEYQQLLPQIERRNEEIRVKYSGKFKGNENNIGASPGGRKSILGIRYVKKRKMVLTQEIIVNYLKQWKDKKKITIKKIDEILGYSYTAGHWFRKDKGGSLPSPEDWIKLKDILGFDNTYDTEMTETRWFLQTLRRHPKGKNPGDLWRIQNAKLLKTHFAVFPEEIPRNAILATCPPDGIVLDPFGGSGTTSKVAKDLKRKSILIELQPQFLPIIKERCGEVKVFDYDERLQIRNA